MTTLLRYNECPGCRCGRATLLEGNSGGMGYPAASLVGQTLSNLERTIRSTRNATEFVEILEKTKREYGISVLVWPDHMIQIR